MGHIVNVEVIVYLCYLHIIFLQCVRSITENRASVDHIKAE